MFKEAKGHYQEKKAQLKSERSGLGRSRTYDRPSSRSVYRHQDNHDHHGHYDQRDYYHEDDDYYYKYHDEGSRQSYYDGHSEAGSRRSVRSRSTHSRRNHHGDRESQYGGSRRGGPALTANNLKTLTEVSSTAPSRAPPNSYRNPYPESKMDMTHAEMRSIAASERRPRSIVSRRQSCSEMGRGRVNHYQGDHYFQDHHQVVRHEEHRGKEIDMDLAYGDCPPDLEDRIDLDPAYKEQVKEDQAQAIARKVETLLDEAHCLQHSAATTIESLQKNPEAAAAVALSLAELSALITKMSPAFLGLLKGGSPAVFALLASPQFLIGTGAVVGITVIMFGGWKIIQKVKEAHAAREALAYEGVPMDRPAPMRTQSEFSTGVDEALLIDDFDEELSTVESWRRGIPASTHETADLELITPEADRATRRHRYKDDDDMKSMKSARTTRTTKTTKSSKKREDVPERKSSRHATESVAGSERSKKSSKKKPMKAIDDGRSEKSDEIEMMFRPKSQRQGSNMLKALFKTKKEKDVRTVVHA